MKNKLMKKCLTAILAGCMTVTLAACGGSGGSGSGSDGEVQKTENGLYPEITFTLGSDWRDLSPVSPNQDGKSYFFYNIYESLFDFDDSGNFVGNIAKEYTVVDDMTYDVTIYDCVTDTEGNNITADDVVYSINWLVDSGNAIGYELFDSVETKEDYTVTFHWTKKPGGSKDMEQIFARTMIFSQKAFEEHNFAKEPVGTGNFKVTEYTTGASLTMEARDDYWGSDPEIAEQRMPYHIATVQKVNIDIVAEASQAAIALEMGTSDICGYISDDMLPEFEDGGQYADQYNVLTALSSDYFTLSGNFGDSICSNSDLMKGIFYAMDNEGLAAAMGSGYVPLKAYGSEYFGDYNPEWENEDTYINTCDLDKAKEYLDKAGYNGETLEMIGLNTEAAKNGMQMLQAQLLQAGINVNINAYDQSGLDATMAVNTGWDLAYTYTGGTSLIGTCGAYNNAINDGYSKFWIKDDTLQSLYETAKADETHDDEHMKEFFDYVLENGYCNVIAAASSSVVAIDDVEEIYLREGYFTPAAFTFK